ncbi:SsgA family sporulation/cell division regulator [Streptomyces sp. NPDC047046]|uniref:SsgA family sporulation/cell division regulator n=1 Tax=Streptomyces sp. NPDC047046 TaxID=3155378 RepID=UPI003410A875
MDGEQSGLRMRQTTPEEDRPALDLVVLRVLDGGTRRPLRAAFRFDPCAPMVVSLTLSPMRGPSVTWRIGRELLRHGLHDESGEGDVRVWAAPGEEGRAAWMRLESRQSSALLELPARAVSRWLAATYLRVPAHAEGRALDWDGFLTSLCDDFAEPTD